MKKKINNRQRSMQRKQQKAQESRKKSLENIKKRELERAKEEILYVSQYEDQIYRNTQLYSSSADELLSIDISFNDQIDDLCIDEEYADDIRYPEKLDKMSRLEVLDFLRSIAKYYKVLQIKLSLIKSNLKIDSSVVRDSAKLQFAKNRNNEIVTMGIVANNSHLIEGVLFRLEVNFVGIVSNALPEIEDNFKSPDLAIERIESYRLKPDFSIPAANKIYSTSSFVGDNSNVIDVN